jgi:hypothetical protein
MTEYGNGKTMAQEWIMVQKGKRTNPNTTITKKPFYVHISNKYASLPDFAADPPPSLPDNTFLPMSNTTPATNINSKPSKFRLRNQRRALARKQRRDRINDENALIDEHITWAEDERTTMAKADMSNMQRRAIDNAHTQKSTKPISITILQRGRNLGYALSTTARVMVRSCINASPHVRFAPHNQVYCYPSDQSGGSEVGSAPSKRSQKSALQGVRCKKCTAHKLPQAVESTEAGIEVTYDSGANGHYISVADMIKAKLPILGKSTKQVGVANGGTSTGVHKTRLPIPGLSTKAATADAFNDFPDSLMSVGATADNGKVSIFARRHHNSQ